MYFRCNLYEEILMARSLGKPGICVLLELGFACNNYQPRIQFRFVLP